VNDTIGKPSSIARYIYGLRVQKRHGKRRAHQHPDEPKDDVRDGRIVIHPLSPTSITSIPAAWARSEFVKLHNLVISLPALKQLVALRIINSGVQMRIDGDFALRFRNDRDASTIDAVQDHAFHFCPPRMPVIEGSSVPRVVRQQRRESAMAQAQAEKSGPRAVFP